MRKGLLLVIVVAAAFAGGAAFQRPELGWARTLLQVRTIEAGPAGDPVPEGKPSDPDPGKVDEIPSAPPPSLVPDGPRPETAHAPAPAEAPKERPTAPPVSTALAEPEPVAGPATPEPLDVKGLVAEASRSEELVPPLAAPTDSGPAPPPVPAPEAPAPADPNWADAPGSVPTARAAEAPAPADPAFRPSVKAPEPAAPDSAKGWTDLRRRMRELGVSRYWVEGEPNGTARFRCVIPLADSHAVGQQFEAEGRDDFQAAEAALRRVVLWKATEAPADSAHGP